MNAYPTVDRYMTKKLITFTPDTEIMAAIDVMLKKKISGAPILNEQKELVGMLSEVDCLRLLLQGPYNDTPVRKDKVAHFMSTNLKTIASSQTIFHAAYEFVHSGYKRLPVVENGKLVGQISRVDVLRAIQNIEPEFKRIPDSWKGRAPVLPEHKKTTYTSNS
jgi:CBS domain-containing protein